MISTRPAAYVRKSHKDAASADAQLASIREHAARDGVNAPLAVYRDDGVSGRHGKRGAKSDWRRLQDDIAAGAVSLVYVTALDRAGRSLREWLDFTALCVDHHVEVRDQSGQNRADGDNEDIAIIEMMMAQREGRKAVERSARGRATQARRGDEVYQGTSAYGRMRVRLDANGDVTDDPKQTAKIVEVPNPDEPMEPLREAIRATQGNVLQAARRLNDLGIPTRSGRPWDPRVLTRALDREGTLRVRRGSSPNGRRRAASDAPLSRLVTCHCGATMTPQRDPRNGRWLVLSCAPGQKAGREAHGRYLARSRHVMDLLQSELRRSRITIVKASPVGDLDERRAALDAKREKLRTALDLDVIDLAEFKRRAEALKRETEELNLASSESTWVGASPLMPVVDWDAPDAEIGEALRKIVRTVRLGEDMLPVEVETLRPWRRRGTPSLPVTAN